MKLTIDRSAIGPILSGVSVLSFLPSVRARAAECVAEWDWSHNSNGRDPCAIGGLLESACMRRPFIYGQLASGYIYPGPSTDDEPHKKCQRNTVLYSLVAACTLCQNYAPSDPLPWVVWSQYCDAVFVTTYPSRIPPNASIPHWAYIDWSHGTFDGTVAKAAGRDPEVTPVLPSVVSISSPTNTPTPATGTLNKSDVGVIVGGVVGGVLGLAGLTILALFLFRRERRGDPNAIPGPNPSTPRPVMSVAGDEEPKLYNPTADPTALPSHMSDGDMSWTAVASEQGSPRSNPFQFGRYGGGSEM